MTALRVWSRDRLALAALFVVTLSLVNPHIRGDGAGYYAYVRSMVIDGDLQFENEYRHGDAAFVAALDGELRLLPTGYRRNHYGVGASMLWAPFFLAAHAVTLATRWLGAAATADGYSPAYRWSCAIGTALYGFVALLLSYDLARRLTRPGAALLATLGIWLASSLPVYMYGLPFHVHALTAFTTALFVWHWFRASSPAAASTVGRERPVSWWVIWGALGGLVVVTYQLNAVFLAIAALELARLWRGGGAPGARRGWVARAGGFAAGFLAVMLPPAIVKTIIHGTALGAQDYPAQLFYWTDPRLLQAGFAAEHGMFLWTPILVPAVVGLWVLWRQDRWHGGVLLAVTGLFYYAIAAYVNWHGHSSFGSRFAVALTPIFVLGLASALDRLWLAPAWSRAVAAAAVALLIAWNVGFVFQWAVNIVPNRGPVDFRQMARHQVTTVPSRLGGFLVRYFRDREGVVREVWNQDLIESRQYRLQR